MNQNPNPLEIKELQESWFTKGELKKMKNEMTSPTRGTSCDKNIKKTPIEADQKE